MFYVNDRVRFTTKKLRMLHIDKEQLLRDIKYQLSISKDKSLQIIQENFPNLVIVGNNITITKPPEGLR